MNSLTETEREALRERYRSERDKRLRPDGNEQYVQPKGRFADLLEDPYVEAVPREPVREEVTVALIGGGFAGLVTGARLKQAGISDVRIIDKAGDVGGVWYWNRYPGAMCDTAAMVYLPLLEETGTVPSMKYVKAPEIFAHARRIATTFGLYENALLSTGITSVTWNDDASRWIICTDRGDELRARFIAMGTGPLHRPKLPGIPGIDTFAGHTFHTARWDYDYTGGGPDGAPMEGLADKRVGIVGTGATAIQCIPHLAKTASELFVFQRTPSSIDVRNNQALEPDWYASLETGWQKKWLENFATLQTGGFADEDLVKDGWTDIAQRIRDRVLEVMASGAQPGPDTVQRAYEESDDEKMNEIRSRVDEIVRDPAAAEALKPWYRQLCKRPCFSDEYLQAYNQPGAHLVDTDGRGVERIDETGVWAAEQHYDLDCLIFASGFEVGTEHSRRAGFEVVGRHGRTLTEHWSEGMLSMHGIHVHGFPNLFILGVAQGANLISNIPHNFVHAATAISAIVKHAEAEGSEQVEVTSDAEGAWVDLLDNGVGSFLANPDCTPGYYNNEGGPIGRRERLNGSGYPNGPVAYFDYLERWRSSGDFAGLAFRS
ncbi:MAG: NAD(P)/FAD-dependent oxidoreductase [Chloroflexi bacterium]|nr:NAD(P)/FAD-dependent oxidoreductase [Chloroflexota bacterium]MCI0816886.1 NAD(P)/FAD-dependent oxidoreductase [Chloroflexota bacterium]MCI0819047.1 NAD(P)/FAD-dependent oxidoreductase [Chloroflexota bacterium]MCI0832136.1 NAD(P)/FAD-dependent oxidoreductase [Chloroflexota bacterium]MCI0839481.1 NAD(P)/FAD-dependent oxidoreductase [Chloroflexota bacterium]